MSGFRCRHALVRTTKPHLSSNPDVRRCARHSPDREDAAIWGWGPVPKPGEGCSCGDSGRFLVAVEGGAVRWRECADVIIGRSRPTVADALCGAECLLYEAPGCALASVAAGESATVFQTSAEQLVLSGAAMAELVCGVCVYPWLAAGYRLADIGGLLWRNPGDA